MRQIVRKYRLTKYQVLCMEKGEVSELGHVVLEGEENFEKARREAMKKFTGKNLFLGECNTEEAVYRLPVEKFLEIAVKDNDEQECS